jgi:hypothetical protein
VALSLVSEGCSVLVEQGSESWVVASFVGAHECVFGIKGAFSLVVVGDGEKSRTSVLLPWRDGVAAGWAFGDSYAQLDLKSRDTISPELQLALDSMQRNFLMREQRLRDEIARLASR